MTEVSAILHELHDILQAILGDVYDTFKGNTSVEAIINEAKFMVEISAVPKELNVMSYKQ